MSEWSHGYNVSTGYTYGFYRELAPNWLDFSAVIQGYVPPPRGAGGSFRYLELGSGQGFGLCLLAAANPAGTFVGIDFNPEHIAHSRELAAAAGLTNIRFLEGDFAELGAAWPQDLGQFEYVTLHGIYSWIPASVRANLVRCIDHATLPGSLVYVSYNAMPGWLTTVPYQHLARQIQLATARSGPDALKEATRLLESMVAVNAPIHRTLPALKPRLEHVAKQNSAYLVQEYLHDNWHPLWFSNVAKELSGAKLTFVSSAHYPEALMPALLPAPMRDIAVSIEDPFLRQDVMDAMLNSGFRRDVFCRGPRKSFGRQPRLVHDTRVMLGSSAKVAEAKIATSAGEAKISAEVVGAVINALQAGPTTLGALAALKEMGGANAAANIQTLILLLNNSVILLANEPDGNRDAAIAFNMEVARAAANGAPYTYLASPVLASGIQSSDVELLLLNAWFRNPSSDQETLARLMLEGLAGLGRGLMHDGAQLTGDALQKRALKLTASFVEATIPRLRNFGVVQ
jgi:SAM-dependent methyltransferase